MKVTRYDAGVPNWADLGSPDLEAAKRFHTGVFGWDPRESGGHTLFHKGDAAVAGLGPVRGPDQPPAWSAYIATDDADATAAKIQELGGTLTVPPTDIPGVGRYALAVDPAGAVFAVIAGATQEA